MSTVFGCNPDVVLTLQEEVQACMAVTSKNEARGGTIDPSDLRMSNPALSIIVIRFTKIIGLPATLMIVC